MSRLNTCFEEANEDYSCHLSPASGKITLKKNLNKRKIYESSNCDFSDSFKKQKVGEIDLDSSADSCDLASIYCDGNECFNELSSDGKILNVECSCVTFNNQCIDTVFTSDPTRERATSNCNNNIYTMEEAAKKADAEFKSQIITLLTKNDDIDDKVFRNIVMKFIMYSLPMKEDLSSVNTKLNNIEKKVDNNTLRIDGLSSQVKDYKEEVTKLRQELADARKEISVNKESIIFEINERNKRYNNLIIYIIE